VLLVSGLIASADLPRKFQSELHASEVLLLAYYIAAVNIETSYQGLMTGHVGGQDYQPFPGLVLTDTFQSYEDGDRLDYEVFRDNNAGLEPQKVLPIAVIVGNLSCSTGQDSANEGNQNEVYPRWIPPSAPTSRRSEGAEEIPRFMIRISAPSSGQLSVLTAEASSAS
jgi:predicted helicase